jgi:hypothetical protein
MSSSGARGHSVPLDASASDSLQGLQTLSDFQQANAHIFPSDSSLKWFWRVHRAELVATGAIVQLAGRVMVDPGAFNKIALAIGRRTVVDRVKSAER